MLKTPVFNEPLTGRKPPLLPPLFKKNPKNPKKKEKKKKGKTNGLYL